MYNARMPINIILSYTSIIKTNTFNIVNCVAVLKEEVTMCSICDVTSSCNTATHTAVRRNVNYLLSQGVPAGE